MTEESKEQIVKIITDFKETGLKTPFKLVGPPACGKLYDTKAIITSLGLTPLVIDCDQLTYGSVKGDTKPFLDRHNAKECIVIFSGIERITDSILEGEIIDLVLDVDTRGFLPIFIETTF